MNSVYQVIQQLSMPFKSGPIRRCT